MDLERATPQELRWRIAQLESELQREKRVREAIESATFWRITLPLRAMLTPLTNLRRRASKLIGRAGETPGLSVSPTFSISNFAHSGSPFDPKAKVNTSAAFIFLDFKWSKTARPCDVGKTSDERELSAGFRSLQIVTKDGRLVAEIDFRLGGNSLSHVCYGFSHIEDWGTWTQGRQSSVLLWLPSGVPDDLLLQISAGSFSEAFATTETDVLANGVSLGTMAFGKDGRHQLPIHLSSVRKTSVAINESNLSLVVAAKPDISIIILNFNKPGITLAAVLAILESKTEYTYEIIVLDNGSSIHAAEQLAQLKLPVRLISLFANRFFGEGNNIAAEHARAPTLLFLNNDAFIEDHTLDLLKAALDSSPEVGATGPVFQYPDGALQEAGAFLNADGTAYQRGKRVPDFDLTALPERGVVDYISAACLMVRREDFMALGGFDLRYDPAYYEDSDLCLRLMAYGKATVLVRDARVRHIENATTSDPRNKGLATNIVERHRQIFLSRWQDWLASRNPSNLPKVWPLNVEAIDAVVADGRGAPSINAVYSPFPLIQGGGERYLIGAALALRSTGLPTAFVTPDEYSAARLNTLMRDLGYPTAELFPEIERKILSRNVNAFVLMGNELFPTREGYGDKRIYHCQFPFPADEEMAAVQAGRKNLAAYRHVVVNSQFTRSAYLKQLEDHGVAGVDVRVIHPPVQTLTLPPTIHKENIILSIGRFSPLGHSKRQDLIVDAMNTLVRDGQSLKGWRLILCGVVPNEAAAITYYQSIIEKSENLPIDVILSPSRKKIEDMLLRAKVYVSATGVGVRSAKDYWKCEHFGITVAEAASAGCIPVVYNIGGPAEIVTKLGVGQIFKSGKSLPEAIRAAALDSEDPAKQTAAIVGAQTYNEVAFMNAWQALL